MSRYKLIFTKRSVKDIEKLDNVVKKKISKKIWLLQENPLYNTRKLVSSDLGEYRLRIGDYRVIFDIRGRTISINRVGHRREIYR